MAFDIWTFCGSASDSACGTAFKTQCFPDSTNCGIGDSSLLTIAQYNDLIPAIVMVLGTAWIFRSLIRLTGVFR
jgi:hypothetical protein